MAKMTLDTLVEQLRAAHGDALEAVVLYGSAARQSGAPTGTIDVLVIVRTLAESSLRGAGAATRAWMQAGHPAPLTLTSVEWRTSADIFAMEYADILAVHRVLHGTLHAEGVVVSRQDLRLQLEREVMGKLIQLRREMQARYGDGAAQRVLLEAAHGTIFAIFRAALRLTDGLAAPYLDSEQVARDVAAKAGFDPSPFLTLLAHRRGTAKIGDKDAAAVVRGCHDGLERLAAWLDGMEKRTADG